MYNVEEKYAYIFDWYLQTIDIWDRWVQQPKNLRHKPRPSLS